MNAWVVSLFGVAGLFAQTLEVRALPNLMKFHLPCNGQASNSATNNNCGDAQLACSQLLPEFDQRFSQIVDQYINAEEQHGIELNVRETTDINSPQGHPLNDPVCDPRSLTQEIIGGRKVYKNAKGQDCGEFVHLNNPSNPSNFKGLLGKQIGPGRFSGSILRSLSLGLRSAIRKCSKTEIRNEISEGTITVTAGACEVVARDVARVLDQTTSSANSALVQEQIQTVCSHHNVQNAGTLNLRSFCENKDTLDYSPELVSSLARGCNLAKTMVSLESVSERVLQCEIHSRTSARRQLATADPGPWTNLVKDVMQECGAYAAEKGEDAAISSFGLNESAGISAGRRAFVKCQENRLIPRLAAYINSNFSSGGQCAL